MGVLSAAANGVTPTAADTVIFAPTVVFLRACKKARKLAESFGEIVLQPIPWLFGYSQLLVQASSQKKVGEKVYETYSKSTPSSSYWIARSTTVCTKVVLFSGVTAVEKYWEPVQPPIARVAFTPCNHHQIWIYLVKNKRDHLTLAWASETKVGNNAALTGSREITEVLAIVALRYGRVRKLAMPESWKETYAKANDKELYFVQEILLGANSVPSQPGYQPAASTSWSEDESRGLCAVSSGGTRVQEGAAMTERGKLRAASSIVAIKACIFNEQQSVRERERVEWADTIYDGATRTRERFCRTVIIYTTKRGNRRIRTWTRTNHASSSSKNSQVYGRGT